MQVTIVEPTNEADNLEIKKSNMIRASSRSDNNLGRFNVSHSPNATVSDISRKKMKILNDYESYEENTRVRKILLEGGDEWGETLKHSNMSHEEFKKYSKSKLYTKVIEAIEYLYKLVTDKNIQLKILTQEIENLNNSNIALNKENILLCEENKIIQQERDEFERSLNEKIDRQRQYFKKAETGTGVEASMINNSSRASAIPGGEDPNYMYNYANQQSNQPHHSPRQNYHTNNTYSNFHPGSNNTTMKKSKSDINIKRNLPYTNTLESVTSSEFRDGLNHDESFVSDMHNESNDPNYFMEICKENNI